MTLYRGPTVPHWKQGQIHRTMMKKPLKQHWTCFFFHGKREIHPTAPLFLSFWQCVWQCFVCVFVCVFFLLPFAISAPPSHYFRPFVCVSVRMCVHSALRLEVIWSYRHQSLSHEVESKWLSERLSAAERESESSTAKQENEWAKRKNERPFFPQLEIDLCQTSSDFFVKIL